MVTARDSILDKCRAYRITEAKRGGVRLSETEALWLEGLLSRLDRVPAPRVQLTPEGRRELRVQVSDAARARASRTDRAERSLLALLQRAAA